MIRKPGPFRLVQLVLLVAAGGYTSIASGDVDPVVSEADNPRVWVGQRGTFRVELRAPGPFQGASSFSIPPIPGVVIVKAGNPVVSSRELEGETWFVQSHSFSLFSQRDGRVTVPRFEVRFGHKEGFTGPSKERSELAPPVQFEVERPPNGDEIGFLVTTDKIILQESWDPQPGSAAPGDIFRRTITQQADQMTGMALSPPPTTVPDGIRVHVAPPIIANEQTRGDFRASRSDTLTYVVQKAGVFEIPAITYVWWNPDRKEYGSATLPAVTFNVQAAFAPSPGSAGGTPLGGRRLWTTGILIMAGILALVAWLGKRHGETLVRRLNPPDRIAARRLLRACRDNDAQAACMAWENWVTHQPASREWSAALTEESQKLLRHIYGPPATTDWQGRSLASAFREQQRGRKRIAREESRQLPDLNPS